MIIRNVLRSGLSEHHLVAISLFDVRCPTATLLRKKPEWWESKTYSILQGILPAFQQRIQKQKKSFVQTIHIHFYFVAV